MAIYLGIDVGGTTIKIGLVSEKFELLDKTSINTRADSEAPDQITQRMMLSCEKFLAENNLNFMDVLAIGLGAPGTILNKSGMYTFTGNLPFRDYPLREKMRKFYSGQIYFGNDANVAALAENRLGAGQGTANTVMITLGTGLGTGVIINNRIYSGFNEAGVEFGHIVIEIDGEYCTCGRNGCWEAYVSASGLIRQTKAAINDNPDSILAQVAEEQGKVNGETVFLAVDRNCPVADRVFARYAYYIQVGMANLINAFMPEMIIMGGGIGYAGERLINSFKQGALDEAMLFGVPMPDFKTAVLGNDAGILGAAILASDCLADGKVY
ncbi:MAG TPA: ROK family protein [Clostridiaceae bacterium]|nr:ROK family protein [Clostridiaceae bacterium]